MTKVCPDCKIEKDANDFHKATRKKNGISIYCKICTNLRTKNHYYKNREKRIKKINEYRETHKEHLREKQKITWKLYREKNKEYLNEYNRKWREENRELARDLTKNWRLNNLEYRNEYKRKRNKEDPSYKLSELLRSRVKGALKGNYKSGSAIRDLGCPIEDLKWWFEFWFDEGMNWDNHGYGKGKWNIDHIKALSKFDLTDRVQFLEACNYKNLQPLWHEDNMLKGAK